MVWDLYVVGTVFVRVRYMYRRVVFFYFFVRNIVFVFVVVFVCGGKIY